MATATRTRAAALPAYVTRREDDVFTGFHFHTRRCGVPVQQYWGVATYGGWAQAEAAMRRDVVALHAQCNALGAPAGEWQPGRTVIHRKAARAQSGIRGVTLERDCWVARWNEPVNTPQSFRGGAGGEGFQRACRARWAAEARIAAAAKRADTERRRRPRVYDI